MRFYGGVQTFEEQALMRSRMPHLEDEDSSCAVSAV
jgi:hypothetical protein